MRRPKSNTTRWRYDRQEYGKQRWRGWWGPGGTRSALQGPQIGTYVVKDDQDQNLGEESMDSWVEGAEEDDLLNEKNFHGK